MMLQTHGPASGFDNPGEDSEAETNAMLAAWNRWSRRVALGETGLFQSFQAGFRAGVSAERERAASGRS